MAIALNAPRMVLQNPVLDSIVIIGARRQSS